MVVRKVRGLKLRSAVAFVIRFTESPLQRGDVSSMSIIGIERKLRCPIALTHKQSRWSRGFRSSPTSPSSIPIPLSFDRLFDLAYPVLSVVRVLFSAGVSFTAGLPQTRAGQVPEPQRTAIEIHLRPRNIRARAMISTTPKRQIQSTFPPIFQLCMLFPCTGPPPGLLFGNAKRCQTHFF